MGTRPGCYELPSLEIIAYFWAKEWDERKRATENQMDDEHEEPQDGDSYDDAEAEEGGEA